MTEALAAASTGRASSFIRRSGTSRPMRHVESLGIKREHDAPSPDQVRPHQSGGPCACRRQVLGTGVAAALLALGARAVAEETDAEREARPKAGDQFVFMAGDRNG